MVIAGLMMREEHEVANRLMHIRGAAVKQQTPQSDRRGS